MSLYRNPAPGWVSSARAQWFTPRGSGSWRSRRAKRRLLVIWLAYRHLKQLRTWRSIWVHAIFARRRSQGEYHNLLQELHSTDPESHFQYLRMSKEGFDVLLSKVITVNYDYCAYTCKHVHSRHFTFSATFFQALSFAWRFLYAFEFTFYKYSNTLTSSINLSMSPIFF